MNKVLILSEEGRGGGALRRILLISKELHGAIKSIVVIPQSSKEYKRSLEESNVEVITSFLHPLTRSVIGAIKYFGFFIPEVLLIVRLIIKLKPDIIHVNGSWQIKGIVAGAITKTKIIWHMNDSYQPESVNRIFRTLSSQPTGYIFASERTRVYYEKLSPRILLKKRTIIIPAPADLGNIDFVNRNRQPRNRFLLIGYINEHKGLELLIRAASLLKEYKLTFDVVGPVLKSQSNYVRALKREMDELKVSNINFIGFKKINTELLARYDYYVCSSIRESSPMAVWEAMASGLPIVSTDVGDVKNIITKNQCGIIADAMSGKSLSKAIILILQSNDDQYKHMSRSCRSTAEKLFGVKALSKRYIRFYSDVISEPSN